MTTLLIDAGNTRIKWAVLASVGSPLQVEMVSYADIASLASCWQAFAFIRAVGCNVAGDDVARQLEVYLPGITWEWLQPAVHRYGLRNAYQQPALLGADRWAALLGVAALGIGDAVVVSAGTALTVDSLTAQGEFLGGSIAPGWNLMLQSLQQGTANLGRRTGQFQMYPNNTADAIWSGCLNAMLGQIELARQTFVRTQARVPTVVLTGGDAVLLASQLSGAVRCVEHLPLLGLARMVEP